MTRLLQVMAGAAHGGAEAFFERLALAFDRAGFDQHLVIRRNAGRAARLAGLPLTELGFGGRLDFLTKPRLARVIARVRPDVVFSWMNRATHFCPPPKGYVLAGRLGGYYDLRHYRHCHHLVANTPDIRDWILGQGWPQARVHYLPNFVDAAPGVPLDRSLLDTPADAPLALALGRLHPNKALDVAITALAQVPRLHLWIGGEGELRADLIRLAQSLGVADRVRFLGWRDDVADLLATADLYLCPSKHEPLGNVVIEAWAHGVPVVACASQGPTQLIKHGESGLLVPIGEAGAMAAAITRLLADPTWAGSLARAGHAAYEHSFTEAAVVARYRDFLTGITLPCAA